MSLRAKRGNLLKHVPAFVAIFCLVLDTRLAGELELTAKGFSRQSGLGLGNNLNYLLI